MKLQKSVFSSAWTHQSAEVWGSQVAKLAGYDAGQPTITREQHGRLGSNPNSVTSQIERVRMLWNAEYLAKNSQLAIGYIRQRSNYCSPQGWMPNTGDSGLNNELRSYIDEWMESGGMNGSAYESFARMANVQLPVRGDSALVWLRDATRLRIMEAGGDQIGELNVYGNPSRVASNGLSYFLGMYFDGSGTRQGFRIYSKGTNDYYFQPADYPSSDVIYFQDSLFGGVRGITIFHGTISTLTKSDQLFQFGLEAAAKQAKTGAVVRNEQGGPTGELSYDTQIEDDGRIVYLERAQDGSTTEYQYNGDAYEFMRTEAPGEELIKGCEYADERSCLSLNVPFSVLVNANAIGGAPSRFEFARAGHEWSRIRRVQTQQFKRMMYVIIMDAIDRGEINGMAIQKISAKKLTSGSPKFSNLPTADAFRETQQDISANRAGLDTREDIAAGNNKNWGTEILPKNKREAMEIEMATQDANRELAKTLSPVDFQPYKPNITVADIAQNSDNPQQSAAGEQMSQGNQIAPGIPSSGKGQVTDNPPNITRGVFSDFDESRHPRNENGEFGKSRSMIPDTMYHGTTKDFDAFSGNDPIFLSSDKSIAKTYAVGGRSVGGGDSPGNGRVLEVRHNAKKSIDLRKWKASDASDGNGIPANKARLQLNKLGISNDELDAIDFPSEDWENVTHVRSLDSNWSEGFSASDFVDLLKRHGFDSARIIEDGKHGLAVFDPGQLEIKSHASLSAYIGDMLASDLPQSTQNDIANILGTNGTTGKLKLIKYGMVPSELERMADSHNLESAQHNIRNVSNRDCSAAVHANAEKHVLINNGKIVDGHHYLARALKGGVTKSLPVIDLTPSRFQGAEWKESDHPRDKDGEFGSGGGKVDRLASRKDLFWRLHGNPEDFSAKNATSTTLDNEGEVNDGYSSFKSPEELLNYWSGGTSVGRTAPGDTPVVAYTGSKTGSGADGEPLSKPDSRESHWITLNDLRAPSVLREMLGGGFHSGKSEAANFIAQKHLDGFAGDDASAHSELLARDFSNDELSDLLTAGRATVRKKYGDFLGVDANGE